jgi:hypothetical protein
MRGEGIVPVMEVGNNNGFNGFGGYGDGAWWIIILLLFGYGRNGFGGFGGNGGVGENYVLATDFATIERKLDGINNGICDSTFALNNTITNGFFGVQNSLTQGFSGLNTALLQGNYALSSQLADCCCKTQRAIDGVNYNMAKNTCDIVQAINTSNQRVIDYMQSEKIDTLNRKLAVAEGQLSNYAQTNAIVSALKQPCPIPAYQVPNPNCCYGACSGTTL